MDILRRLFQKEDFNETLISYLQSCEFDREVDLIESRGCLVVRDYLPTEPLLALNDELLSLHDTAEGLLDDNERRMLGRGMVSGELFSKLKNQPQHLIVDRVAELICSGRLSMLIKAVLSEPYMVPQVHFRIKSGKTPETAIPFHQHFIEGDDVSKPFLLAISIPFCPYNQENPRMEVVAKNTLGKLPINATPATQFGEFEIDEKLVIAKYKNHLWSPQMNVGDFFVFRETNIHRTKVEAGMAGIRTSVDIRVFCMENSPGRFKDIENPIKL